MTERLIVVDDDQDQCDLLEASLRGLGYDVATFTRAKAALDAVTAGDVAAVLTDLAMDGMDGLELTERVRGVRPDVPVVLVTGQGSMDSAIAALRVGAYDFVQKPVDGKVLRLVVGRAVEHRRLCRELERLREASDAGAQRTLVGRGRAMREVFDLVERVSASDASVLVHGETGTGKELIARAIHAASPRAKRPFVAINCAAVPATLLESELFGHVKGAFTDARADRKGLFQQAEGGTLFLDEIGEMPLEMQPKLLRALQERVVRPVGASAEVAFDARLVAATNKDLGAEVYEKRFREDLYYRINVVTVELPPLRERGTDVLDLAAHFLARYARPGLSTELSPAVAQKLMAYAWPGNVRELENCVERAVALARFDQITVDDLPERVQAYRAERPAPTEVLDEIVTLDEVERRYVTRALALLEGNKSKAAELLGLDRRTLYRKLERWEKAAARGEPTS